MALSHLLDTTPPRLLPAAACGGLRSAPDRRTRRALLHLSYSSAPPFGPVMLVTQDPQRLLAAGDVLDIVERVAERLLPVLPARSCQMRRQDDVLQGEQLVLGCRRLIDHDVEPGSTDPVGGQRIIARVLVDHGARQVLIRIGIGFISPSSPPPSVWGRVSSGTCKLTMSEIFNSSENSPKRAPSASSASPPSRSTS